VIIGAGTQGQVYVSYLKEAGINITGFIDDNPELEGETILGIPILGKYKDLFLDEFKNKIQDVYCPIGINSVRTEYLSTLKKEGYGIPGFLHHTVSIAPDVTIGEAVYMLAGNIVMPHTTIGSYIMINMDTTIAHHVSIEDGVFISSGVNIGALMNVRKNAYIGMGVTAMTGVKEIGKETLIGAGTVIIKNVPDYSTVVGNPGRVIKTKHINLKLNNKPKPSEITFIGSGISSSFTILHFLDLIEGHKTKRKININIIDKYREFHSGIPYGSRSGFSVHLITSLKNFLPEPELEKFIKWLNKNKNWLLDELKKDGGTLSKEWIIKHTDKIQNNEWKDLFIPRRFFGWYINEKVESRLEEFKTKEIVNVNYINAEVVDIEKKEKKHELFLDNKETVFSDKVILSVGSLPVNHLWKNETIIEEDNLLFVNDPYSSELTGVLSKINNFLEKKSDKKVNALIVGANASALELLYKLNDIEKIKSRIHKFLMLSTQGMLPDAVIDEERKKEYTPFNLQALTKENNLTAKIIAEATFKDLDYADQIHLGAASTVDIISRAFGVLLEKLTPEELKKFACHYGNEIGKRQRCAGFHYSKTVEELKKENRFDHIAGRFNDIRKTKTGEYSLEYLDTQSGENKAYEDTVSIVINCAGSTNLDNQNIPELLKNVIEKEYCIPNESKIGFEVNEALEASDNLHVVGPLLAGNVFEGKAVWHVEHCGRIIWLSKVLSEKINDYFLKNAALKEKPI
jgi:sugar O-acyltransferase (sialic acid O-acetyltransferase NeuD family)